MPRWPSATSRTTTTTTWAPGFAAQQRRARYLYRVYESWFVGAQGIYQNFSISGDTAFDELLLDILGVAPYKSGGLGLVAYHGSRDNDFKPTKGWWSVRATWPTASRSVASGLRRLPRRLPPLPPAGRRERFCVSPAEPSHKGRPDPKSLPGQLRGYKTGQYTGRYMSQLEAEARIKIAERWTAAVFAGVACTYGGVKDCSESANLFPMAGAGVQYVLKPELGIVLNLEYAQGKDGNNGVILKTGYTIALCAAYLWMPTAAGTPSVATVRNRPAA